MHSIETGPLLSGLQAMMRSWSTAYPDRYTAHALPVSVDAWHKAGQEIRLGMNHLNASSPSRPLFDSDALRQVPGLVDIRPLKDGDVVG